MSAPRPAGTVLQAVVQQRDQHAELPDAERRDRQDVGARKAHARANASGGNRQATPMA